MGVISECSLFQGSVQRHHQMLLDAVVVVPFPSMSPGMYMGLYIDDRIPQCERIACVTRFYCPHHTGSHMPSLEDLSPFLEGGYFNAKSLTLFRTANGDSPFVHLCIHSPRTGDPCFYRYFRFRGCCHESDIPLWKLPREITHDISVQHAFTRSEKSIFFCDGLWKTRCQRSDQRELFMGTDSEEEPDESDDD